MSKKAAGKSGPAPDASLGEVHPSESIYEQLEHSVWNLSSPSEQYEAFTKAFNYHADGICHEAILSEELFLISAQCRKYGITANKLGVVVVCLKQLFELLERHQFEERRQAFEWVCDYLKQRTAVGEDALGSNSTEVKLTQDECCQIVEYITDSILKEFDLFAAVFGYPMDHEIMDVTKHLPTPIPILPPLAASAKYEPMKEQSEPASLSGDQGEQRMPLQPGGEEMVAIDVSRAKAEVERTIVNRQAELESRLNKAPLGLSR